MLKRVVRSFGLFGWLLGLHVSLFADLGVYHQKIDDERLYEARAWQLLLHVSGGESEMDDPAFFFSPEGKRDPRAELHAFIDRLYETDAPENNATACRFPARTAWALEALQLSDLPSVSCPKYDAFMRQIDPHSVTFVFADAHINSPASMFGHTFLRIDSTKESKLLSHAVSYAAGVNAQNENGLVFAVKGLLGGYKGLYSLTRYYDKLKEYTNVEQRDMWEYPLNLIQDEVKRMVMHIWELRNSYSMYYFFDENCAYHMLWLLEIARETVHLCAYYYYPVIPPETIFAIKQEGLVAGYDYRASKRTLLSNYATAFDAAQRRRVYALARGEEEPERLLEEYATPLQIRQWILEAAAERCEADYIGGTLAKAAYQERFLAILKARAALGAGEKRTVATPSNPALAHASGRLRYGFGVNDEGRQSHYLGIRSAYQDISESDTGRLRGTQIEFLDLLIGLRPVQKHADEVHTYLERFTLLSLGSYAPMDAFADPISWRMRLGADTQSLDAHPRAYAGVGAGVSVASDRGYGYMMVDPFGYYDASQTLWGGGGAVGGVFYPTQRFKIHAEYRHRWYASGRRQHLAHALCTFDMSRNAALTGSYEYVQRLLDDEQRTVLGVNLYF